MDRVQKMSIEFGCEPANEGFARVSVAAFAARLNPTIEEVSDIKMAVSEAVTNSIIHGYYQMEQGRICVECQIERDMLTVCIKDNGRGIPDIKKLWNRCIPQDRSSNVQVWDLHLCRHLWMMYPWNPHPEKVQ